MSTTLSSAIGVLIVDDHAFLRMGLRLFLESQPELAVVGEAATCTEALAIAASAQPDVIVLDLDFNGESAIDGIPDLLAIAPEARVLILTGVRDPNLHRQAVHLGAVGLVLKENAAEVLLQAIKKVHAGEVWLEGRMMANVLNEMRRSRTAQKADPEVAKIATLTARERDVIALIGEGLKNRQIAERLGISETTVRHHMNAIFNKLEVTDRLELVVYAYRHGLVTLSR